MLTDNSPDFKDTWEFIDRRLEEYGNCQDTRSGINQITNTVLNGVNYFTNSLFKNNNTNNN